MFNLISANTKLIKHIIICLLIVSLILTTTLLNRNATGLTDTPLLSQQDQETFGCVTVGQTVSVLKQPKTYTICNYTTPDSLGVISEIVVYMNTLPAGTEIKAVIFANDPDGNFPSGNGPLAMSEPLVATSQFDGQWVNFTMNYLATPHTTYWLGYYSNNYTKYTYDLNDAYLTVTSQAMAEDSTGNPISWSYDQKKIMSLYAIYTSINSTLEPTSTPYVVPTSAPSLNPTPQRTPTPSSILNPTAKASPSSKSNTINLDDLESGSAFFGYIATGELVSAFKQPKTYTLCNYTTPSDVGVISEVRIYLDCPEGSLIKAVIFANDPGGNFPEGVEPLAESPPITTVSSVSGQWYKFTMNLTVEQNTTYWLGYYCNNQTKYAYDRNDDFLTVTSQPVKVDSTGNPISWSYREKTVMSLCAVYFPSESGGSLDANKIFGEDGFLTESELDVCFIFFLVVGESWIFAKGNTKKRQDGTSGT
jgi:hypothetical protein